jgi:hypothetical protein
MKNSNEGLKGRSRSIKKSICKIKIAARADEDAKNVSSGFLPFFLINYEACFKAIRKSTF